LESYPRLLVLVTLVVVSVFGAHSFPVAEVIRANQQVTITSEDSGVEVIPSRLVTLYCSGCHANGRAKVDLDGSYEPQHLQRDRETWEKVLAKLQSREMPPAKSPPLSDEDRQAMIAWIEHELSPDRAADLGRVVSRRLRRAEYVNTIRDLLGIQFEPDADFPGDEKPGWDFHHEVAVLPTALLEPYDAAADRILEKTVVANLPRGSSPDVETACVDPEAAPLSGIEIRVNLPACTSAGEVDDARSTLVAFASRAFRRPLAPGEAENLVGVLETAQREGQDSETALKAALKAVLTSPHFLHHVEILPAPNEDRARDEFALASRLSYFLWSSLPDEELRDQAARGVLRENLEQQARRMLKDPKARALAIGFAHSWLGLELLQMRGDIDPALRESMQQETEHFVAGIVQEDRSVLEFLEADYTFVNERLAEHYGIAGVRSNKLQRVSVSGTQRGGLLTQASILAITSPSGGTSPVQRGKWVMERLLGTPPPAPPAGLLEGFATTRKNFPQGTARQILELHRAHPSCTHCHAPLDGFGMALENFSGDGAWRTEELQRPINASVTLPTGESFDGPAQLKAYLLGKRDLFVRGLSRKLLGYALDRKLHERDRVTLEGAPESVAQNDYRFSSAVIEVVKSAAFQPSWDEQQR
jgi:hypothetical protein